MWRSRTPPSANIGLALDNVALAIVEGGWKHCEQHDSPRRQTLLQSPVTKGRQNTWIAQSALRLNLPFLRILFGRTVPGASIFWLAKPNSNPVNRPTNESAHAAFQARETQS